MLIIRHQMRSPPYEPERHRISCSRFHGETGRTTSRISREASTLSAFQATLSNNGCCGSDPITTLQARAQVGCSPRSRAMPAPRVQLGVRRTAISVWMQILRTLIPSTLPRPLHESRLDTIISTNDNANGGPATAPGRETLRGSCSSHLLRAMDDASLSRNSDGIEIRRGSDRGLELR